MSSHCDIRKVPSLYVPKGFEPERFLSPAHRRSGDRARYLLHSIQHQTLFNQSLKKSKQGVRLKAEYLRSAMGRRYAGIVRDLEAGGVVAVERVARDGQSNRYRLGSEYRSRTISRFEPTDGYLCRKLLAWETERQQIIQKLSPARKHLHKQLQRITIEQDAALRSLNRLNRSRKSHVIIEASILRLADQEWFFTADKYGRVHHNISCLKRELREHLRVDGEQLAEIDIANSQPLLVGLLAQEGQKHGPSTRKHNQPFFTPLRCAGFEDVRAYLAVCERGEFYEHLAAGAGMDVSTDAARQRFKQRVFSELFYAKRIIHTKPLVKGFQKEFPSVFQTVKAYHDRDYRALAREMQRRESELVIDGVVQQFAEAKPDAFILTIHDSVLVKRADLEYVQQLFAKAFGLLGVQPKLKLKEYEKRTA